MLFLVIDAKRLPLLFLGIQLIIRKCTRCWRFNLMPDSSYLCSQCGGHSLLLEGGNKLYGVKGDSKGKTTDFLLGKR